MHCLTIKLIKGTLLCSDCLLTLRTSASLHGDNIVWATCAGALILRNHNDEILDQVKVHTSQIWWIEV
jgi:hypothetical protein